MGEEKRRSPRVRCRLGCTLRWDGREVRGTVRDVSAGGLAVLTDLEVGEGEHLRAAVEPPLGGAVEVDAIVWHAHRVRSRHTGAAGFLLGLVVSSPPEAWFQRVGAPRPGPARGDSAPASPANCCEADAPASFRVRLKQSASPRTRAYRLEAASAEEARARAEADARDGWQVIEVGPA